MRKNKSINIMLSSCREGNRLLVQCLLACALLCFVSHKANAACANWSYGIGAENQSLIFPGTVGEHPVRMMLHYDNSAKAFDGVYGYSNQPGVLRLTGHMLSDDSGVYLNERDRSGRITGYFRLMFTRPRKPWESTASYARAMKLSGCSFLTGTWISPNGKNVKSVSLYQDGVIVPRFDKQRALNEMVAYKLRLAMLRGDKKLFASLLRYPFYSENGMQIPTKWDTPRDVMNNYNKIMTFSSDLVRNAVPHVLRTTVKTYFMNGSVFIKNGKVVRICEAACANTSP